MNTKQKLMNFIWGTATRLANRLQRYKILGSNSRTVFRKIGHLIVPSPDTELQFTCPTGLQMISPARFRGARSYAAGTYEEYLTQLVLRTLKPQMTAVDVGALIGYYTLIFAKLVGHQGQVFAFEPEPKSFEYLQQNIKINSFTNVEAMPFAAADCSGKRLFIPSHTNNIGPIGGTFSTLQDKSKTGINVPIISLDDFFSQRGWPLVDFIKIDVDGAEPLILNGMKELNHRNPNLQLVMEIDPSWMQVNNSTHQQIVFLLKEMRFTKGHIAELNVHFRLENGFPGHHGHYNVLFEKSK